MDEIIHVDSFQELAPEVLMDIANCCNDDHASLAFQIHFEIQLYYKSERINEMEDWLVKYATE